MVELRERISEKLKIDVSEIELSMGMSSDYMEAVALPILFC